MSSSRWKMILVATVATAGIGLALVSRGSATETITYAYDALGRLRTSTHAGSVNSGQQTSYDLDPAGNRKNATTTGASP